MANRHKFARGGGAKKKTDDAEEHEVEHEAGLKFKRGGHSKRAEGGKVPGRKHGGRLDKRARGGGVGSDKHPFSSAHVKPTVPGGGPAPHHLKHHGVK